MKKITTSFKSNEKKFIFTEGIDYFKTSKKSIWGNGDKYTIKLLKKSDMKGKWLNLAAGDGRYNLDLLRKVDSVTANDIDESALSKLYHNTPEKYRPNLKIKSFDITKKFPFKSKEFDGVFSTGNLHLFPTNIFRKIFLEMDRVLKSNGKVFIDFATDIKRETINGKLITFGKEPGYSLDNAKKLLPDIFKKYKTEIYQSSVEEENKKGSPAYKFSCNFIIMIAQKRS